MQKNSNDTFVVAISSRALFDLDASHQVYVSEGVEAYRAHQIANEDIPLAPGVAFHLVRKLLALNPPAPATPMVEVILLSRNTADTGLRVMNSIEHYAMPITRAAFAGGGNPRRYLQAFGAGLFLSTDSEEVREVLAQGHAAAAILPSRPVDGDSDILRIAFDGDAVLFSDASERVFKSQGLQAFSATEKAAAMTPMDDGPFRGFLAALHRMQSRFPSEDAPIRTALVTARSAPAHERVIRTLRAWDIRIDEALFLGGMPKGEFLRAFGADIFFDDQAGHCESARKYVPTAHVPFGIANEQKARG